MNGLVRRPISLALLLLVAGACTERRLFVRTEPAGAIVKINGKRIGASPAEWEFDHYGPVRIEVELDGYEPRERLLYLESPWWQKPWVDLAADVLVPAKFTDNHEITLTLEPTPPRTEESTERDLRGVIERASKLRKRAEEETE